METSGYSGGDLGSLAVFAKGYLIQTMHARRTHYRPMGPLPLP